MKYPLQQHKIQEQVLEVFLLPGYPLEAHLQLRPKAQITTVAQTVTDILSAQQNKMFVSPYSRMCIMTNLSVMR